MIAVIAGRLFTAQAFDRCQHATLKLVVIVGVEQVMLTVVLILYHGLHLAQALSKLATGGGAFITGAIGIPAPVQIHLGKVISTLPQPTINCVLHARAIGTGFCPENAPSGLTCRQFRAQSFAFKLRTLAAYFSRQRVQLVRFIQRCHRLHRGIEQTDQIGKRVPEEPGHAQGHIHSRSIQQADRQDLEVIDPLTARRPHRAYAHQGHRLSDIIAAGAHGCRAPHRQAELAQVVAVILQMAFENQVGRLKANPPGRGRGQIAHVHRKEVTSGGQYVEPTATGRTARARRHKTAAQGIQQTLHFRRAAGIQTRCNHCQQSVKNRANIRPFIAVRKLQFTQQRLFDQLRGVQLKAFTAIPGGAPQRVANGLQLGWLSRCPGFGQRTVKRVKAQFKGFGQRAQYTRLRSPAITPRNTQQGQQGVYAQTPGR